MKKKKPIIGYTGSDRFDALQWLIALSIRLAGGKPLRLRPSSPKYETKIDGLLLGGGVDISPSLYAHQMKLSYDYDQERDDMEIKWMKAVTDNDLPILAICRGVQMLNVWRGGTLHADISKIHEAENYPTGLIGYLLYRKKITIGEDTLLHNILGTDRLMVNSLHRQALDDLGDGVKVTALEDNGIAQAMEVPKMKFCLGLQFHPEALIYRKDCRRIFEAFVSAATTNI